MPRKRTHDEMLVSDSAPATPAMQQESELLHKVRNMWEFAALCEFISIFGHAARIPTIDVEDLEMECTAPAPSHKLEEIGFQLIKFVSSRRDITLDNWDTTVRNQYEYKMKDKPHPYGAGEQPNKFRDFHIFTKLRVLYRLAQWTFWNPDNMKKYFPESKETDQFLDWQAHPCGWDRHDRVYYKLGGNRLYRRTDPPIPLPTSKPKSKYTSKKAQAHRKRQRTSTRRRVADSEDGDTEMGDADETMDETQLNGEAATEQSIADTDPEKLNTYGDYKWECIAITLEDYNQFIATIAKSKDPNEKNIKAVIEEDMIPELVKREERRQRKLEERLREEQLNAKMAGAKRSGRLAAKQEKEREEAEAAEAERQRHALLIEARKEEENQRKNEDERRNRMQTREQRIKEREYKRVLLEEQLARDSEEEQKIAEGGVRGSRHLKERIEMRKKALEEFEDDEWTFDCSGCGRHGKNWDDGEHSIACERCNVWQHSKCLGFSKAAAESDDFHFICKDCLRKEEEINRPKISLKFKVGQSSSPPQPSIQMDTAQGSPTKQQPKTVDAFSANGLSRTSVNGDRIGDSHSSSVPDPSAPTQQESSPVAPAAQPVLPADAATTFKPMFDPPSGQPAQERLPDGAHDQVSSQHVTHPQQPLVRPQHSHHTPSQPPLRPTSSHSEAQTPRLPSSPLRANGFSSPMRQRIPSPIINRPTMSPTQGNPDVGPIAGVPGSSPIMQPASLAVQHSYGDDHRQSHTNGSPRQSTPNQYASAQNSSFSASQQSTTQPVSGLSPKKQRISISPLPQPRLVPQKSRPYSTPSSSFNAMASRTVSGTPIFPPAENLAPSPQQLNREPVPTPSKHESPYPPGTHINDRLSSNQQQMSADQPSSSDQQPQQQTQSGTVQ